MLELITRNLSTIAVGAVVFGILAAVVLKMIRDKKNHGFSCSCGCDNCPSSGLCHRD